MFSFQIYICWQTENKNMSRLGIDIAQDCSSQDLRIVKLQKEEASYCEA